MQKIINFCGRRKDESKFYQAVFDLLVKYRKWRFDRWLKKL